MDEKTEICSNIDEFLVQAAARLALYLEEVLPRLGDGWWKKNVLDVLSAQQRKRLESGRISSLGGLDLAALLRVLDSNWHLLSDILNLTYQDRHFLKEMQLIRNRWAHRSSEGFSGEDIYRDLDTIKRFLRFVGADERTTEEIQAVKKRLLEAENEALDTPDTPGTADGGAGGTDSAEGESAPEFEMGQMVRLKSNPDMRGAVVGVLPGTPEARFNVFINNGVQTLYASQLLHETVTEEKQNLVSCEEFHAYLTALQLRHPSLSNLYSLNAARINYIPYQFRPVLRFIRSDRPRLLIADSVGVGKTIEAGLILRELQARRDLRSVLIICPKPLLTEKKWQREMKRFEENFTQLDGATLQYCIEEMDLDGVWPGQHQKCILPYSLLDEALLLGSGGGRRTKRKKGLLDLDPAPRFDLVIVDEAHHIRNPGTLRHRAVRFFCDHAEAVVFLTATPVQMGSRDLFVLLNALRPDLVIDQETFEHMAAPNSHINAAVAAMRSRSESWQEDAFLALGQAAATPWGEAILRNNPDFCRIRAALQEPSVSGEERVRMISDTENLHSFSGIINRTRRCDIGSFTVRKPETVLVDFTPGQKLLHDELLRIQAEVYSRLFDKAAVKFLMTTIRRQAASCVFGLAPFLEEILGRHLGELGLEEGDDLEQLDGGTVTAMQGEIRGLLERTKKIDPADPKYDALCRLVRDKQKLRNNKIMLFSSFRHTLNYLYERLSREGFRVGLVHGGVPDEQRLALRRRFERDMSEPDGIDIMLFSEIGCEGLDYQFCDCIVNYDLPWNPMRIEQRIGRIDRNGQKSETVSIINLITPGTVDADIYNRCLVRIGVFENALGAGEAILGEITREIQDIAENYELTEQERQDRLQQLADNKIREVQEEERLERNQAELFGIQLPQELLNREIADAASFWLSPESLMRLVRLYLRTRCGKEQECILGEKALRTLRLSQESRAGLLEDFQALPGRSGPAGREWENWLKGAKQHLPLTFESDCAMEHPEAAFVMPLHPLVRQAARSMDSADKVTVSLWAVSKDVPQGYYDFAVYQWRFFGIREDLSFRFISSDTAAAPFLNALLQKACDNIALSRNDIAGKISAEKLDGRHYEIWSRAKEEYREQTREMVRFRRESLSTSHRARLALLTEQLQQADNEKIRKMRQSQIAAAEADYARHVQELEIAQERADIISSPVAYGVLHISGE